MSNSKNVPFFYFTLWTKLLISSVILCLSFLPNLTTSQLISLQKSSIKTVNNNNRQNNNNNYNNRISQRQTPNRCPIQCTCTNGVQIECSTANFISIKQLLELDDFNARTVENLRLPQNNITHLLENDLISQTRKLKIVLSKKKKSNQGCREMSVGWSSSQCFLYLLKKP